MYTGIVQGLIPIKSTDWQEGLLSFSVDLPDSLIHGLETGASVSFNGVCLTVTAINGNEVCFDAIAATLALSNLAHLSEGTMVNVERSANHGAEIGGHVLSGHIIGTATVKQVERSENNCRMTFQIDGDWLKYVFDKGFLAVNGASLTVADLSLTDGTFVINLIPETMKRTNFALLKEGDPVNIEVEGQTQVIVDTVERVMATRYANS
jgi:riboflavin synthase